MTAAAARINIKNIDYFKYKKLVIDGNRDDYNACSKEVKLLCDSVQLLNFRDEEFDDESDRGRFGEIISLYRQILGSKRIDPLDMRIKSGWWGDHKNAYSAGKIKPQALKDVLLHKAKDWSHRHGGSPDHIKALTTKIDGPGLFIFKHKDHQCFQFIGRADKIFSKCGEKLKAAFEGSLQEPLASLLIISMASDWDFYFLPVGPKDDEKILRILENDLILKHDCIWPHGLNSSLHIDSLLEVSEFRKSCIRHSWPPDGDALDSLEIDIEKLRNMVQNMPSMEIPVAEVAPLRKKTKPKEDEKEKEKPQWTDDFRIDRKVKEPSTPDKKAKRDREDRPSSPASITSDNAEMTSSTTSSSSDTQKQPAPTSTPRSQKKQAQAKAVTVVKKTSAKIPTSPKKEPIKNKSVQKAPSSHSTESDKPVNGSQVDTGIHPDPGSPTLENDQENKTETATSIEQSSGQDEHPLYLRKETTHIISKSDLPESPDKQQDQDEADSGTIDSSTRPVTPTLEHESAVDSDNFASQVTAALEQVEIEAEDEDEKNEDGQTESEKTRIPSPRKIPKATIKAKKVSK